jgi:hypothetical protein
MLHAPCAVDRGLRRAPVNRGERRSPVDYAEHDEGFSRLAPETAAAPDTEPSSVSIALPLSATTPVVVEVAPGVSAAVAASITAAEVALMVSGRSVAVAASAVEPNWQGWGEIRLAGAELTRLGIWLAGLPRFFSLKRVSGEASFRPPRPSRCRF